MVAVPIAGLVGGIECGYQTDAIVDALMMTIGGVGHADTDQIAIGFPLETGDDRNATLNAKRQLSRS